MKEPNLFQEPNKYAQMGSLKILNDDEIEVKGYNCYKVTKDAIYPNDYAGLIAKYSLLKSHIRDLGGKTFLDLGCSTGFYSILARFNGAKEIIAVDMDKNQLNILSFISLWFNWKNIRTYLKNFQEWTQGADIVCALALVHWIYSCTSLMGSLDKAVAKLAKLTKEIIFIEWIEPNDVSINWFKHIEFNKEIISEPYNKDNFLKALNRYFRKTEHIGNVSETREIYRCLK